MIETDHEIIKLCQKGQLEEFGKLYDIYIKKIYDFIYFKTTHKETAEDLTSLTFTKALQNISKFNQNQGTFSAWLFRIARNTVIDHYRTKKQNSNIDDIWDLAEDNDIERDLDTKMQLDKIKIFLEKLTSEQRELVIMRVWQGMSYKEIAGITGKTEASCKMSFSRTIAKIRQEAGVTALLLLLFIHI